MIKRLIPMFLIGCLIFPVNALAQTESNTLNEESKLIKMTDTCLGDIISSKDQVNIDDNTTASKISLFSLNENVSDENEIKNIIEEYNKTVFLSIIGHETNISSNYVANQDLQNELNARSIYLGENYGGGSTFTSYDFDVNYDDFVVDGDKAKAVITRVITFQTTLDGKDYPIDAKLPQQEGYILQKINGQWKLVNVIFNSEGIENDAIDALKESDSSTEWIDEFNFDNLKRDQYEDTKTFTEMLDSNGEINLDSLESPSIEYSAAYNDPSLLSPMATLAGYSKALCEQYAIQYGYNINNEYRWFEQDCTNFASQCISAGGLQQSAYWYYNGYNDYSRSWTVVDDLRDFIMNHTLSAGYYEDLPEYYYDGVSIGGTLIQYSNGTAWVHSAIIRAVNNNGIYVAEHDGVASPGNPDGNYSYHLHGTSLDNKRTFWIARGY